MPQNYTGRVFLIVVVLLAAVVAIFAPSIFHPQEIGFNPGVPWTQKTALKPGIDISGGVSLLYEVEQPSGTQALPDLATEVTSALKKRVDPDGLLNLIWRPQNPNRLEIQLPFSGANGEGAKRQEAVDQARVALEATNIRMADVNQWLEKGPTRDPNQANTLANGSPSRLTLLNELAKVYDESKQATSELNAAYSEEEAGNTAKDEARVQAAVTRQTAAREMQRKSQARYSELLDQLAASNVSPAQLDLIFRKRDKKALSQDIQTAKAKAAAANYPARTQAVAAYLDARQADTQGGGTLESAADLKRMLRGSGVLEFHILPNVSQIPGPPGNESAGYAGWVQRLQTFGPRHQGTEDYRWFEVEDPEQFKDAGRTVAYEDSRYILASVKPDDSLDRRSANGEWKLVDARRQTTQLGQQLVAFQFDSTGASVFGALTTRHKGEAMAIMLDGRVISAPVIQSEITSGSGTISGGPDGFTTKELNFLVSMLKAGALPAQLSEEPIYERAVGPQLGADNLFRGLAACGCGLVIVAIFLVVYYYTAGLVAFIGVLLNLVLILGTMAAFSATFTLPGIAAIVLTVGSAVDSNVLIFERLREEQQRGLGLRLALRNAYDRAFSAIVDSNMTTLITSAFLVLFGTEEVKGFGITLIIGIVASLFTSLFVTKTIFGLLIDKFGVKTLSSLPLTYPRWKQVPPSACPLDAAGAAVRRLQRPVHRRGYRPLRLQRRPGPRHGHRVRVRHRRHIRA